MNSYSKELLVKMLLSKFEDNGISPRVIHDQMDRWLIYLELCGIEMELDNESLKMFSTYGVMHANWKDPQNHMDEIVEMIKDWITGSGVGRTR